MTNKKKLSKESLVLYISMLVMGACGISYEYTFSKMASDLLGNSARQWAIIIGLMMFFMGIGADLQKYLSDKKLLDKFITVEIILGLAGGFGPIVLLYTFGALPSHYTLIHYLFIIIVGLLIGFEIPLLVRINETYTEKLAFNLGGILKMDYVGSFIGALVWIFILPRFFTIIEMAFVLAIFNTFVAVLTFLYFYRLIIEKKKISIILVTSLIALISGFSYAEKWTVFAEQSLYRDKIVYSTTTPYQHIVITKNRANAISCYINGHLQFNSFDEHIYHENLVHPAFALAPIKKKILVLGGGDGLALREVLKYSEVESITLCDIDPQMTDLAINNPYFNDLNKGSLKNSKLTILKNNALIEVGKTELLEQNQTKSYGQSWEKVGDVNIINMDAALFVEQVSGVYDIIIIDFPDPNSLELSKLYSKKFYTSIVKKLSANGILVQQSTSPIHAKEAFLAIGRTMEVSGLAVIPYHENIPSFGEWGWWIGGKKDRYSKESIKKKFANIQEIPVETKYLTADLLKGAFVFGKEQLHSKNNDINTILNNRTYYYYIEGWEQFM